MQEISILLDQNSLEVSNWVASEHDENIISVTHGAHGKLENQSNLFYMEFIF